MYHRRSVLRNQAGWVRVLSATRAPLSWTARIVVGLWVYTIAASIVLIYRLLGGQHEDLPAFLIIVPPQATFSLILWALLGRPGLAPARRLAWGLLLAATLFDLLGIVDWSYFASITNQPFGTWADALYMVNYVLLTCAAVAFLVSCGGSFTRARIWADAAIIGVSVFAALLPLLFTPLLEPRPSYIGSPTWSLCYAVAIAVSITALSLLLIQIADWRRHLPVALFATGILAGMLTDVFSIAANVRGHFQLGNLDQLAYCWIYAWVGTAILLEQQRKEPVTTAVPTDGYADSFLPVVAVLISIVIVLTAGRNHPGFSGTATTVLLVAGTVLVVARQLGIRYKFHALNDKLATQQAEVRLGELLRRSRDMVAVVSPDGTVVYASPAAAAVIGRTADEVMGRRADELLGAPNEARLAALLDEARADGAAPVEVEISAPAGPRLWRTVQVWASSELDNTLINGIVLTARDVTDQRAAEQSMLELSASERQRLADAVHEGIAQDLAGLALSVKSLATGKATGARPVQEALLDVAQQLNRTLDAARRLARGLSPLAVVHGSLIAALEALAADTAARTSIAVRVRYEEPPLLDTGVAEQLYYVARDTLEAAVQRPHCRHVDIELYSAVPGTVLAVWDDAPASPEPRTADEAAALRSIEYRARMIGGTLRVARGADVATRVEVTVPPLAHLSRKG